MRRGRELDDVLFWAEVACTRVMTRAVATFSMNLATRNGGDVTGHRLDLPPRHPWDEVPLPLRHTRVGAGPADAPAFRRLS